MCECDIKLGHIRVVLSYHIISYDKGPYYLYLSCCCCRCRSLTPSLISQVSQSVSQSLGHQINSPLAMQMCGGGGGGVDLRQLVGGLLTMFMFFMLANMICSDHFPSSSSSSSSLHSDADADADAHETGRNLNDTPTPCWHSHSQMPHSNSNNGFITFSLAPTPLHHISQVTDAVVIARYLGATLLLPDIRRSLIGHTRNFEDLYDVHNFMSALTGIVKVTKQLPQDMLTRQPALLRITNRLSQHKIETQILPVFTRNNYLRLALVYQSTTLESSNQLYTDKELLAASCVAMFQSLELRPGLQQVGDKMIQRLRELAANPNGEFVAVDWKLDVRGKSSCVLDAVAERKRCYNATELASFLKKTGFGQETVLYLTEEAWWHDSLKTLKNDFPKTYTKDEVLPDEEKGQFLRAGNEDLKKALDIYVCSKSDTFVATVHGPFYSHVSGRRIASGRTRILSPIQSVSEKLAQDSDFLSPFVSKKTHMAYSCYC